MGKKWMTAAVTAAAAVAIAGCGGSDGDSATTATTTAAASSAAGALELAEFRQNATAICVNAERALSNVRVDVTTIEGARTYTAARRAAQIRALRSLSELNPPANLAASFEQLQEVLEARSAALEPVQIQMLTRDPALRESFVAINSQDEDLQRLILELKLPRCYWS
ncbi:hypothetical protein VSS74_04070 [Conexibacter stalactiti]|uniref:Lipoprotein n=1 Tax=Conexibacter stalactiti TaxID=1940611 RepID=A0ABU4HJL1_9ACTN|nr:hypothetical protein [Conexibacter stalactiti]MDW5593499.1 hypothetical protein [Conexibacter stalactiti]MEC5034140.1 hypothetical protein [Conexibacter stalactiti]